MVPEKGVKAKYNDNHKFYKYLDLYANVSLSFSIPSIKSRHSNVDIAVIRENTEGQRKLIQANFQEYNMKYILESWNLSKSQQRNPPLGLSSMPSNLPISVDAKRLQSFTKQI
jgi:isocitrate/isopropylmalate dehydrogenase